jgi:hypothetical protein
LHDLSIPKSKANLDHVGVHPSAQFLVYIDTKAWHSKGAKIKWDRDRLMYGPWDKTANLRTVEWEASRLAEIIRLPVICVIACDGGTVVGNQGPQTRIIQVGDSYVMQAEDLMFNLGNLGAGLPTDPRAVRKVRNRIREQFPAAR